MRGRSKESFAAEGLHGVDGGGAAGGDESCGEAYGEDTGEGGAEGGGVSGGEVVEHRGHEVGGEEGEREPEGDADRDDAEGFAQDHDQDLLLARAHGHADADFSGAAADAVREHAVEADRDQQCGQQSKEEREAREEALIGVRIFEDGSLGHGLFERQVGVEGMDGPLDGRQEGERIALDMDLDFHGGRRVAHLRIGKVRHGMRSLIDTAVFAIFRDADDGEGLVLRIVQLAEPMAERTGVGQELLHEGFVDDDNARRGGRIGVAQVAASEERNAEGAEEIRPNVVGAERNLLKGTGDAVDGGFVVLAPAAADAVAHEGGGVNARERAHAVEEIVVEGEAFGAGMGLLRRNAEDEEAWHAHTEAGALVVEEGAHEQSSGGEEGEAEGDLEGEDDGSAAAGVRAGTGAGAEGSSKRSAGGGAQRRETKNKGCEDGDGSGEQEDGAIRGEASVNARPGGEGAGSGEGKDPAERCAGGDQETAFGEKLTEKSTAVGAEGETEAEIALAGGVAGDDEHGDVAAGDEEDERDQSHEDADGFLIVVAGALQAFGGCEDEVKFLLLGRRCCTEVGEGSGAESRSECGDGLLR